MKIIMEVVAQTGENKKCAVDFGANPDPDDAAARRPEHNGSGANRGWGVNVIDKSDVHRFIHNNQLTINCYLTGKS